MSRVRWTSPERRAVPQRHGKEQPVVGLIAGCCRCDTADMLAGPFAQAPNETVSAQADPYRDLVDLVDQVRPPAFGVDSQADVGDVQQARRIAASPLDER